MTVTIQYNDLTIEVFDDPVFNQNRDSLTSYDKIYQPDKERDYIPVSQHAITVYRNDARIVNAILLAAAGATSVTSDSVLIDKDNLVIRCCNIVFSLTLPDLRLNWMVEADWATCFSIHKYQDTYITHGETSITRIGTSGNIIWQYGGADIFVRLEGGDPFKMYEDYIELMDFNGSLYKLDYNGKTIEYKESNYHKKEAVTVYLRSPKPWWKFW